MKKLFIKLQTPTIELKVTAKDVAGDKDSFLVGFKRYDIKESDKKLKLFQEALEDQLEASTNESESTKIEDFIKDNVVYLKNISVDIIDEDEKPTKLSIPDTRKAKPVVDLWDTEEECLEALLDNFLASAPYKSTLISSMQKALFNTSYEDESVKN